MAPTDRKTTWAIAALLGLSGFGSLVLQVGWMREFRLVFGASTAASAAVVAIFMGGLGLGSALLGPRADRADRPLRLYALLELGISLAAALSPAGIAAVGAAYVALGGQTTLGLAGATLARLFGATLVLAAPTILMGGVLPAAVRAATTSEDANRRAVSVLYGANTLGAVAGAALSTFWLLPILGTRWTLWAACAVELTVALGAWRLARATAQTRTANAGRVAAPSQAAPATGERSVPPSARKRQETEPAPAPPAVATSFLYAAAAIVGFAFFLMELVWFRMLAPILGGTTYTFGLILAVALLGIGLGGASYALVFGRRRPTLGAFAVTCGLESLCIAVPLALGDRLAIQAAVWSAQSASFAASVWGWTLVAATVVLPASVLAGIQYPILVALLGEGKREVGRQVGFCAAWNTIGAIAGSLAGGFGALPLLGAPGAWRMVIALLAGLGLVAALFSRRSAERLEHPVPSKRRGSVTVSRAVGRFRLGARALPYAAAAVAVALIHAEGPTAVWRHSGIGASRVGLPSGRTPNHWRDWMHRCRRHLIWEAEGVEASIGLVADHAISFFINGKSDGNALADAGTQITLGLLPAMLHGEPRTALIVGLGTGESAGWLAEVASIERVDVVEIEPAVDEMARHCAAVNFNVLHHSKVRRIYNDAREVLLTTSARYDVISSEPSNPYRAGISSLFTREFYDAVRRRLRPEGIFVQWLQGYEVDERTVRTVLATLRCEFENVEIWQSEVGDLLLVCTERPVELSAERLRETIGREPFRSGLAHGWRAADLEAVLARYVAGPALVESWRKGGGARVNTDDHNVVEYGFARMLGRDSPGFSINRLRSAAVEQSADRPRVVGGRVDWSLVEDHRQLLAAASRHGEAFPFDPAPWRTARAAMLEAYAAADTRRLVAIWEASGHEPVFPAEVSLLALALADQGDPRAQPLGERLRRFYPVEADAVEAYRLSRQGDLPSAVEHLERALLALRADPWGWSHAVELCFVVAEQIERSQPQYAARIYAALSEPFAVYAHESSRLRAAHDVAQRLGVEAVVETTAAMEPWVPWDEPFLAARWRAYRAASHPLAARARRDLDSFQRAASGSPAARTAWKP